MLIEHSDKKLFLLSALQYITDFIDTINTLEKCVYVFCYSKKAADEWSIHKLDESEIESILVIWCKLLNIIGDMRPKSMVDTTSFT